MKVHVELHSTEPSAVEATRATIRALTGGGDLIEEEGRFYLVGSDFVSWAAERQGYIKKIVRDGTQESK